jgi:two-component system sensor histidine kinase CpxA
MEIALGILEQRIDEQTAPYLADVRDEVAHMQKLAHELLNFTKASLGDNRVQLEEIAVAEITAQAIEQEQAAGKVEIIVPADLCVIAHRELLLRALANLVRNAVRYAADGGPITITAWRSSETVVISVADHGPGVPAAELARLFDPFYRLDKSRTSETGGTGLGLAIVKTCVEACRGTVTALNRQPHGLEIQISCPVAAKRGRNPDPIFQTQ